MKDTKVLPPCILPLDERERGLRLCVAGPALDPIAVHDAKVGGEEVVAVVEGVEHAVGEAGLLGGQQLAGEVGEGLQEADGALRQALKRRKGTISLKEECRLNLSS